MKLINAIRDLIIGTLAVAFLFTAVFAAHRLLGVAG